MILIYAAAESMPRIIEEAPPFFGKHLNYLKDKYPSYFTHSDTALTLTSSQSLVQSAELKMMGSLKEYFTVSGLKRGGIDKILIMTKNSFTQLMQSLRAEI